MDFHLLLKNISNTFSQKILDTAEKFTTEKKHQKEQFKKQQKQLVI